MDCMRETGVVRNDLGFWRTYVYNVENTLDAAMTAALVALYQVSLGRGLMPAVLATLQVYK